MFVKLFVNVAAIFKTNRKFCMFHTIFVASIVDFDDFFDFHNKSSRKYRNTQQLPQMFTDVSP